MADNFNVIDLGNGYAAHVNTEPNPILGYNWIVYENKPGPKMSKEHGYGKTYDLAESAARSAASALPPMTATSSSKSDTQSTSTSTSDKVKGAAQAAGAAATGYIRNRMKQAESNDKMVTDKMSSTPGHIGLNQQGKLNMAANSGNIATRNVPAYQQESLNQQNTATQNAVNRAWEAANRYRQNAGVDTARTPEMLRSEHYARLADRLNNASYWRPGVFYAAAGQPMQGDVGGVYQMPQIQTEDQRQQEINRQRWGEKLGYQELGVPKDADTLARQLDQMGMQGAYDLEKLRSMQPQLLAQMARVNSVAIDNVLANLSPAAAAIINNAAAGDQAKINTYGLWLGARTGDPFKDLAMAASLGLHAPSVMDLLGYSASGSIGDLFQQVIDYIGGGSK